ncbi:MAG TPA: molybdopterin cofactor-binding domain-containing protein, partial [Candidatus Acidoferrum sp.]|nr:molybdopterin cofactor-binding domain-containing protein [Candidatus Acidoferrum sp.]
PQGNGEVSLGRREFLQALGGGITIFFTCGSAAAQGRRPRAVQELPADFNAFLRINEDGRVTCFTGKVELGQGAMTSLAQMLAEELDVPAGLVDMVMGDTDLCPWDAVTAGSRTTRFFGPPLRAAGAEARAVLLQLAAEHLGVRVEQLQVQEGVVIDRNNSAKRVTYAQLAKGKSIVRHLSSKAPLKPVSLFRVIGKDHPRKDALEKVTGMAHYAGDIRLPGMLYAKILRPPSHGARLKSLDSTALKDIGGVQFVKDGDLVAVLHPHPEAAEEALSRIKAQYDVPEARVDEQTIYQHLLDVAPPGEVVTEGGNIREGEKFAAESFEASYFDHYIAHAPIETHTALARVGKDKVTVWASTQRPFGVKEDIAEALGVPSAKVRVISPYVGGGFGGKSNSQQAVEASRLSKLTGKPVQVAWTREEEFFFDLFRPAAIVKIRSGVTSTKRIVFWASDV